MKKLLFELGIRAVSRPGAPSGGHRGCARTGRPGRASGTMAPSRTTNVPLTSTCLMPADDRRDALPAMLAGRWAVILKRFRDYMHQR